MAPETIVGIVVAAVVVLGALWWFFGRNSTEGRGEPELPSTKERAEEPPQRKPKREAPAKAEAKPAKETKAARASEEASAGEEPPEGEEDGAPDEDEAPEEAEAPAAEAGADAEDDEADGAEEAPAAAARDASPKEEDVKALRKGLASTRGGFIARLARLFGKKREIDPELLDEVQEVLLTADIGVKTSDKILEQLKARMAKDELPDEDSVWAALREEAREILGGRGNLVLKGTPSVILVVGVNGVGKTTTIGKLASRFKEEGRKVMLAAGDTFRAAAVLQLEVWGRRVGCDVVKGKDRADPASVIFDAIKRAQDEGVDIVMADTAGRLHTKSNLMEELKKVVRTAEKALGGPVDEILLVLDSTTGQNAIQQAQLFKDAIDVSGIALTKLDGTAKGGVILGIVDEHGLPVHFVGIGERVEDLREFDAPTFVEALFAKPDDETMAA